MSALAYRRPEIDPPNVVLRMGGTTHYLEDARAEQIGREILAAVGLDVTALEADRAEARRRASMWEAIAEGRRQEAERARAAVLRELRAILAPSVFSCVGDGATPASRARADVVAAFRAAVEEIEKRHGIVVAPATSAAAAPPAPAPAPT
jgi:hypothetical protein